MNKKITLFLIFILVFLPFISSTLHAEDLRESQTESTWYNNYEMWFLGAFNVTPATTSASGYSAQAYVRTVIASMAVNYTVHNDGSVSYIVLTLAGPGGSYLVQPLSNGQVRMMSLGEVGVFKLKSVALPKLRYDVTLEKKWEADYSQSYDESFITGEGTSGEEVIPPVEAGAADSVSDLYVDEYTYALNISEYEVALAEEAGGNATYLEGYGIHILSQNSVDDFGDQLFQEATLFAANTTGENLGVEGAVGVRNIITVLGKVGARFTVPFKKGLNWLRARTSSMTVKVKEVGKGIKSFIASSTSKVGKYISSSYKSVLSAIKNAGSNVKNVVGGFAHKIRTGLKKLAIGLKHAGASFLNLFKKPIILLVIVIVAIAVVVLIVSRS